jgi:hypothetical protein
MRYRIEGVLCTPLDAWRYFVTAGGTARGFMAETTPACKWPEYEEHEILDAIRDYAEEPNTWCDRADNWRQLSDHPDIAQIEEALVTYIRAQQAAP